jgi:5-methylcytosine-specific restriction enzyme A
MPWKTKQPCIEPGCGILSDQSRCEKHRKQATRDYERRRGSAFSRGYTKQWSAAAKAWLRQHPLCAACGQSATEVDHIKPHKGDMTLFWDSKNWQSLCKRHHAQKTASEDGGFGNKRTVKKGDNVHPNAG